MEERIQQVIEERIRPNLQAHGGDIEYRSYEEGTGTLTVALTGACGGCPFAQETLRVQVEQVIRESLPEVRAVRREA